MTPANTAVQVQARVRSTAGKISRFKTVATWSSRDDRIRRTSGGAQRDWVARLNTDTLQAVSGVSLNGYRLRILPLRTPGTSATPTVRALHAVASRPATRRQPTGRPLYGGKTLAVPRYSQMTHRGQYPQYGGGGQAWCSPTSLSMILGYYRSLPTRANYAWVNDSYADPSVDHVARVVYDYGYEGAGNWAFNTAYGAILAGNAFVTRLAGPRARPSASSARASRRPPRSRSAAASPPARRSASTAGHLVVHSLRVHPRGQGRCERPRRPEQPLGPAHLRPRPVRTGLETSFAGTVYVVRDAAHPLPARAGSSAW